MLGNISAMFTGKPHVAELGYAFLFRNYNSSLGKWSTSDPLVYPDSWNNFAYCNNWATNAIDWQGTWSLLVGAVVAEMGNVINGLTLDLLNNTKDFVKNNRYLYE